MNLKWLNCLLLFIWVFVPSLCTGSTDKTGFEHCIFNFVDFKAIESQESRDLTERFLVFYEGYQLRTVTVLPDPKYPADNNRNRSEDQQHDSLVDHGFLRESCSVNFLVSIQRNLTLDFTHIFGPRLYSAQNILLIIFKEDFLFTSLSQYSLVINHGIVKLRWKSCYTMVVC